MLGTCPELVECSDAEEYLAMQWTADKVVGQVEKTSVPKHEAQDQTFPYVNPNPNRKWHVEQVGIMLQ